MDWPSSANAAARGVASLLPKDSSLRRWSAGVWSRFLENRDLPIRLKVNGQLLRLAPQFRSLPAEYEEEALRVFLARVEEGNTVWDVGAHIGIYSILSAFKVGPKGRVLAIEPNSENFSYLERHLRENGVKPGVEALMMAINDGASGQVLFSMEPKIGCSARIVRNGEANSIPATLVPAISLDGLCQRLGYAPDLIKLDVEGAEGLVLQGATSLLTGAFSKRPAILMEAHPQYFAAYGYDLSFLKALIKKVGYHPVDLKGGEATLETWASCWLFPD